MIFTSNNMNVLLFGHAIQKLLQSTMFQESFYMFKSLKKNTWTNDFFVSKIFFPYQMLNNFKFL
jgi:hypothetical protein